ncbi:MAG: glycosyltransferase family 4 protein [Acidobacteriota bacterium]|nr:glycosyltransferase family 4 protein [Acidobacteriota bacterium]
MSRVLLVCPEPLGHGQPAGIGIRFVEIARVLLADGHGVTILSPDAGAVEGCRAEPLETFVTASEAHDMAVIQGHVANAFFQHAHPIPTVVDLYDPFIIENLHYYAERGDEVFQHDHATLMESLAHGDYFLCASEAQRLFYLGLLLAAGRLNPVLFEEDPRLESLIGIAPFGVQPPRPETTRDLASPAILFGGIYDWYDPISAIETVAIVRESIPDATLTFTTHPNPEITPQGKLAEAIAHARSKNYPFVRFEPWAPYEQRADFFERFTLALLTFPRSIETDLSMRTRVYDYLWCGLPIVTSSAPGTDELLMRYSAGSVIGAGAPQAFADEIVAILSDRERYAAMSSGARRFVSEHQWDRTLAPLREFCRAPRSEKTKDAFALRPALTQRPSSILDRLKRRLRA